MDNESGQITPPIIVPHIEEDIPLPKSAAEAMPELTPQQELDMRAATIKLMSDLTGQNIEPSQQNIDEATEIAKEMISNPAYKPDYARYQNETLAFLAGMVSQMNVSIVQDLADLKMYVVNNLIKEVETAKEAKARISALSKLGEVDGVDAFKKRTEMTVKQLSLEEVEDELLETLRSLKGRVVDGEVLESKVSGE